MTRLDTFQAWCTEHGIWLDPRLEIVQSRTSETFAITVMGTEDIPPRKTVAKIPKSSILSVKTCSKASQIKPVMGTTDEGDDVLWLSLALVIELSLGIRSPWHAYLECLPSTIVPIAALWDSGMGQDGINALEWLRGTEVARLAKDEDTMSSLVKFYEHVTLPLLKRLGVVSSFHDLQRAYSLASSRSFQVDAYHKIGMVPVADAFDHIEENQVHFESDHHVCSECGSFDECTHDQEAQGGRPIPRQAAEGDEECEMVTNSFIHAGSEVFNTYDSKATNAHLLFNYGFMLEANSNDVVRWTFDEIREAVNVDCSEEDFTGILAQCRGYVARFPPGVVDAVTQPNPEEEPGIKLSFTVNADGLVSRDLLAIITLLNFLQESNVAHEAQAKVSLSPIGDSFANMAARLVILVDDADNNELEYDMNDSLLLAVCSNLQTLCEKRVERIGRTERGSDDWLEVLDAIPEDHRLTRMAISYALSERSLLEACAVFWAGIAEQIRLIPIVDQ